MIKFNNQSAFTESPTKKKSQEKHNRLSQDKLGAHWHVRDQKWLQSYGLDLAWQESWRCKTGGSGIRQRETQMINTKENVTEGNNKGGSDQSDLLETSSKQQHLMSALWHPAVT